ncbi:hypothetical protein K6119_09710 [Paracrocinitomix mangrovi]|uniref:hypothetical protein n=1 Tax=Paracrocinitomix mangrovi TaxID=2862509 RepID=UPI001C8DCDFF|nr:hypothetical protein [Paracrocinitomix mangrovi]UKN03765.1 hypothetical protein K6119_09710 [Paracrocinitomix mangrovi]
MNRKSLFYIFLISCNILISCQKEGCTEIHADNYNEKAEVDDGTCSYADGKYSYVEHETVKITIGVADSWGPISESDVQIYHENVFITGFLEGMSTNTYYIDAELFLNADVKINDIVYATASAFGMSGSGWVNMNAAGELDFGYVMIN